jgi:hypothetical protein
LVAITQRARVEFAGALSDNPAGDRDHLGIEIALGAPELRWPNLVGGGQREQRHSDATRLDHHHPLAPDEC